MITMPLRHTHSKSRRADLPGRRLERLSRGSRPRARALSALAVCLLLGACAGLPGRPAAPPATPALDSLAPARWQAAWPHGGQVEKLTAWWQRFDDPVLTRLVTAAQAQSATVASAAARIASARATRVAAGAALGPQVDAGAGLSRSRQTLGLAPATGLSASVQAGWEIDLFGANAAARDAAQARLGSAQAQWHDARVAVAAELANGYLNLRACEARLAQAERDTASRTETARLTGLTARAGFQAPAEAALADASAAQARANLADQRTSCELELKALVALTDLPEPALREALAPGRARVPQAGAPAGSRWQVPAQALAQRPDLLAAEREVVASAAEVQQSQADRLPRVTLAGSVGAARQSSAGFSSDGVVWSLGPLQLSLPLFDGGRRAAQVDAARARYDEAVVLYRARLRNAVREVEEALVRLQGSEQRSADLRAALDGYNAALRAAQARYQAGTASLFELEDARRNAVQAELALIELQRGRSSAYVQLYRAMGGGWEATEPVAAGVSTRAPPPT